MKKVIKRKGSTSGRVEKPSRPLERYIQVLEVIAAFPEQTTLADLATILSLPKSTTYRLLRALQESQLITRGSGQSAGYALASRLLQLVHTGSLGTEIEQVVQHHLKELAEQTNLTSYITKLVGTEVRSIAMRAPSSSWCVYVEPGSVMAPHATASAKAILAFQPESVLKIALAGPLPKLTSRTQTNIASVLAEYREIRRTGIARCNAEDVEGFGALAAPILIPKVGIFYSVGITGPLNIVDRAAKKYATHLKASAEKLSNAIQTGERISTARQPVKFH